MATTDRNLGGNWIFIGVVLFLAVAALIALIMLPYFATKPKSREELMHTLPTPPPPQSTKAPSPAASPSVKNR